MIDVYVLCCHHLQIANNDVLQLQLCKQAGDGERDAAFLFLTRDICRGVRPCDVPRLTVDDRAELLINDQTGTLAHQLLVVVQTHFSSDPPAN